MYGASEGLDVLVLESRSSGGQAGSISRIENYLGFPFGIRPRPYRSGVYSGTKVCCGDSHSQGHSTRLRSEINIVEVENGARIPARTIVIAIGSYYTRPPLKNLSRFKAWASIMRRFKAWASIIRQHLWMHNPVMEKKQL
jgi:thioredoxin reductase (NADPH)